MLKLLPIMKGYTPEDKTRPRYTCTNVSLVCEREIGELVQPGSM